MNLTIDIGNTRSKTALFKGEDLQEVQVLNPEESEHTLKAYLENHPEIYNIIFSTVGASLNEIDTSMIDGVLLQLDHDTPLPIQNKYASMETLGSDRLSNAVGAAHLFPNQNVLVIDAGTCITFDVVDKDGNYWGGSISNGLNMRFQALNTFTENLPLIAHNHTTDPDLIGKTTTESIRSGVINGTIAELSGMIGEYNEQFDSLKVILTGGDSEYIERALGIRIDNKKNEIFANPNLVHVGLNAILNFYVESKLH